jgi:hypothetical protein
MIGQQFGEWHHSIIPPKHNVKSDLTMDILLIFSECVTVKFKKRNSSLETGRKMVYLVPVSILSCTQQGKHSQTEHRRDEDLVEWGGMQKAFLKGGNLSCCQHIRQHWETYRARCEEAKIPTHHWAIP